MSTPSKPQDSPVGWVNEHIRKYVDSGGADGHEWRGITTLLLTTTGRKSGQHHRTALIYGEDGGNHVIVASKGGAPNHPAWFLNLQADPEVTVQVKDQVFAAKARVATGSERDRLWRRMVEIFPNYADYQAKTDREIPVIVLERS